MRYAHLAYEREAQELTYRVYLTDALRLACENTARIGGGSTIGKRWVEIADAQNRRPLARDTRSPEEIVADIAEKAGLTII